jgi:hypothetical protein
MIQNMNDAAASYFRLVCLGHVVNRKTGWTESRNTCISDDGADPGCVPRDDETSIKGTRVKACRACHFSEIEIVEWVTLHAWVEAFRPFSDVAEQSSACHREIFLGWRGQLEVGDQGGEGVHVATRNVGTEAARFDKRRTTTREGIIS